MNKRPVILLFATALFVVATLFLYMRFRKGHDFSKIDFKRDLRGRIIVKKVINLKDDFDEVVCWDKKIYLRKQTEIEIHCLDSLGNEIKIFNKGFSTQPFRIASWTLDRNGISIADATQYRLIRLNFNDSITSRKEMNVKFIRCSRLNATQFLLTEGYPERGFYIFNETNNSLTRADFPFDDYDTPILSLDGFLNAQGNEVFHTCLMTGFFFKLDSLGHYQFGHKTIDETPVPGIVKGSAGSVRYDPLTHMVNSSSALYKERLLIYSFKKSKSDGTLGSIVDAYDREDGHYTKSYLVSDYKGIKLKNIFSSDSTLFGIHGRYLIEYALL